MMAWAFGRQLLLALRREAMMTDPHRDEYVIKLARESEPTESGYKTFTLEYLMVQIPRGQEIPTGEPTFTLNGEVASKEEAHSWIQQHFGSACKSEATLIQRWCEEHKTWHPWNGTIEDGM
jgi:hypothetical protein